LSEEDIAKTNLREEWKVKIKQIKFNTFLKKVFMYIKNIKRIFVYLHLIYLLNFHLVIKI
ncbi:hypothetical protein, partial [Parachlamydia acanthamoebae]